jgi:hypothetical protein
LRIILCSSSKSFWCSIRYHIKRASLPKYCPLLTSLLHLIHCNILTAHSSHHDPGYVSPSNTWVLKGLHVTKEHRSRDRATRIYQTRQLALCSFREDGVEGGRALDSKWCYLETLKKHAPDWVLFGIYWPIGCQRLLMDAAPIRRACSSILLIPPLFAYSPLSSGFTRCSLRRVCASSNTLREVVREGRGAEVTLVR